MVTGQCGHLDCLNTVSLAFNKAVLKQTLHIISENIYAYLDFSAKEEHNYAFDGLFKRGL